MLVEHGISVAGRHRSLGGEGKSSPFGPISPSPRETMASMLGGAWLKGPRASRRAVDEPSSASGPR